MPPAGGIGGAFLRATLRVGVGMRGEPRVLHRDDAVLLAAYRDLFIQRWSGQGTAAQVRHMVETHRRFVVEHGAKRTIALSHVVTASTRPPDDAARAAMNEHTRIMKDVRAVATVIEADGFGAAMIRSIVSGLVLLSRGDAEHQVFSAPQEGLAFLLRHRDPGAPAMALDELVSAYARVVA